MSKTSRGSIELSIVDKHASSLLVEDLWTKNAMFKDVVENLIEGVYFVDTRRRIVYWNNAAERLTGYSAEEVAGRSCSEQILRHVGQNGEQLCILGCPLKGTMSDGQPRKAQVYLHHKEGHRVPIVVQARPIRDENGEIVGSVEMFTIRNGGVFSDVDTERRTSLYYIDPLTKIGNRVFAQNKIESALSGLSEENAEMGLLFIDIDKFKGVNDTWGHNVGDRILSMVGRTLANGLRPDDYPSRWGGEEFLVILPHTNVEGLMVVAERVRMLIENSWLHLDDGKILKVTASVGAAMGHVGDSANELVAEADSRMYKVKALGGNKVCGPDGLAVHSW